MYASELRNQVRSFTQNLPLKSVRNKRGYHWFVVGTVCVGALMAALDASIINIALPDLKQQFHIPMRIVEWISLVYLLTLAGLIVPFGRLADLAGRRWMYTFGFAIFVVGSLFCGISDSLPMLLVARAVQAVGAAMLQANSVAIITAATPAADRGKAIGIQASAQGIGLSLGPAVGGAIVSFLTWRWMFFINVPIGILGIILGVLWLPRDEKKAEREKFDYFGAVLLIPALVSLIYVLNMGLKQGWTSSPIVIGDLVFVLGITAFMFVEQTISSPMVDLTLFQRRKFTLGNLTGVLSFAVMYAVLLLTPFYLDNVRGMTAFHAGLYLVVIPLGMTLFTPISGFLADRYGARLPTLTGMFTAALGCALLAWMGVSASATALVTGLFLVGVGVGMFTPPNNSSVMGSTPLHRLGIAGGMLNMSRTLGMGLGITLGGLLYQWFLSAVGETDEAAASVPHMIYAFRWSFLAVSAVALVALLLSVFATTASNKRGPN